jgi:hypothetical protein
MIILLLIYAITCIVCSVLLYGFNLAYFQNWLYDEYPKYKDFTKKYMDNNKSDHIRFCLWISLMALPVSPYMLIIQAPYVQWYHYGWQWK